MCGDDVMLACATCMCTQAIEKSARDEMRGVVEKALASPYPDDKELYTHIFHQQACVHGGACIEYSRVTAESAERARLRLLDALHGAVAPSVA